MFMSCNVAGVISDNGRLHAAAVCRAAGEPLAIEEIVVDPPKAFEIRIKIVCTTLCHTDITFWQAKVKWCAQWPQFSSCANTDQSECLFFFTILTSSVGGTSISKNLGTRGLRVRM